MPSSAPTSGPIIAVVLNWNGASWTERCVRALEASHPVPPQIVIVDNASTDDSVARLSKSCPAVELLRAPSNLGYAGGMNLGIASAMRRGARAVLLMNNDVEVASDCVAKLDAALEADASIGAAGPMIVLPGEPPRIWAAGGELVHRENVSRLRGHGNIANGRFRADEDVDYLPGCTLLLRSGAIEKVGRLDESFFCYMEDVEFGRRLVDAGWKNRFVAGAVATHAASASTGGGYTPARKYMNAVNSVHFLKRHGSLRGWLGFVVFDVLLWPLALVRATAAGRPGAAFAKLRGIFDGLCGVPVTPERIQRYLRDRHDRSDAPPDLPAGR